MCKSECGGEWWGLGRRERLRREKKQTGEIRKWIKRVSDTRNGCIC